MPDDDELLERILARVDRTRPCWRHRGCGKVRVRRRLLDVGRELYRILVLDGQPLLPHQHLVRDCGACVSPWHATLREVSPDWRGQDLPLLLEIIEVLKEDRRLGRKYDRRHYGDFPDILLAQARAFYPGIRRWMT